MARKQSTYKSQAASADTATLAYLFSGLIVGVAIGYYRFGSQTQSTQ
jgi:F0F1-type ATP synthase assembly protein I